MRKMGRRRAVGRKKGRVAKEEIKMVFWNVAGLKKKERLLRVR